MEHMGACKQCRRTALPPSGLCEPLSSTGMFSAAHHSRLSLLCCRGQVDTVVRLISTSAHTGALALLVRFRGLQPAACTGSPAAGNTCLHYVACHRLALTLPDLPPLLLCCRRDWRRQDFRSPGCRCDPHVSTPVRLSCREVMHEQQQAYTGKHWVA